jgi:phosphoribosylformimino-5-aminoimidazole carboxamide ribotide isomerase
MLIIPAIDLVQGKCVRLFQGKINKLEVFSDNPVIFAKKFENDGAKIIHVVDLEGAIKGDIVNLNALKKIVKSVNVPIQFGGGIRDVQTINKILKIGVKRVIIGTTFVLGSKDKIKFILNKFLDKIIVGIDAYKLNLAIKGWKEITKTNALNFARDVEKIGAKRIIFTDVKKDGTLSGPNIKTIKKIISAVKIPVIASGGISSISDVKKLKSLNLEGIIIGKALYTGAINLKDAIKEAEN